MLFLLVHPLIPVSKWCKHIMRYIFVHKSTLILIAASVVMSLPDITPIFFNCVPSFIIPHQTLPPAICVTLIIMNIIVNCLL